MLTIVFGAGWYVVILWGFDFMSLFSGNSLLDIMSNCCHLEQKMRLFEAFSRVIMQYYTRQLPVSTSILIIKLILLYLWLFYQAYTVYGGQGGGGRGKKLKRKQTETNSKTNRCDLFTKTSLDKQKNCLFLIGCWLYAIGQYRTWKQPNPHAGFTFECIINLVFNKNNTSCWCIFI